MDVGTDRGLHFRLVVTLVLILATTVFLGGAAWFLLSTLAAAVAVVTDTTPGVVLQITFLAIGLGVAAHFILSRYDPKPLATTPVDEVASAGPTPVETPKSVENALIRLAQQVDVPRPNLHVVDSDVPNAYTNGHSPSSATVVVTTGLLDRLHEPEVEAVLAHELVHIVHRDQFVIVVAAAPLSIAWRLRAFTDEKWAEFAEHGTNPFLGVGTVALYAVAAVFGLIGRIVVSTHSRYREFAADSGSVAIIGAPAALAGALRKLDDTTVPEADMRDTTTVSPVRAFVSPDSFLDNEFRHSWTDDIAPWLDPYPDTEDRLDRLCKLTD